MSGVVISVPSAFLTRFKSRARLEAEVPALRHRVNVLNRTAPKRVRFTGFDGLLVHVGVTSHPTAEWISRRISEALTVVSAYLVIRRNLKIRQEKELTSLLLE